MLALVVMEHALRNRAQCGDVIGAPDPGQSNAEGTSPQASFL
jgi:chorismate synthase